MSESFVTNSNTTENQPTIPPTTFVMLKKCREKEPQPIDIEKEMKRRGPLPGSIISAPWRQSKWTL